MRRSPPQINDALADPKADAPKLLEPNAISFAQRLTCTIAETCEVTGLGRTKVYELIGNGLLPRGRLAADASCLCDRYYR
jgi:hypothetical protein